jgi:two-component system, NarL family, sensor histidine kinase DegS
LLETTSRRLKSDPEKALEKLRTVENLNRSALSDIRVLLSDIGPGKVAGKNLAVLLKNWLGSVQQNMPGTKIEVDIKGESSLPNDVTHEIYRIAQEAVNNIIKHSDASLIKVSLNSGFEEIKMVITDNGSGFDLEKLDDGKTFGINIMKERASLIGASLNIKSSPLGGTKVVLSYKKGNQES